MSLRSRPRLPSPPPLSCPRVLAVGTSSRVSQCRFAGSVRSSIMSKISSFSADTIILQCSSSMKPHPPGRGQYKSYFCTNILFGLLNNFFRLRVTSTNVYIHTHTHSRIALRRDTTSAIGLSLNMSTQSSDVIWHCHSLPFDASYCLAVPRPIGELKKKQRTMNFVYTLKGFPPS